MTRFGQSRPGWILADAQALLEGSIWFSYNPGMTLHAPGYMHWSKTHRVARYELAGSGMPSAPIGPLIADYPAGSPGVSGGYGDRDLIAAIAGWRGVSTDRVLPCMGASGANFTALAAATLDGGCVLFESPGYDPFERIAALLRVEVRRFERDPAGGYLPDLSQIESLLAAPTAALVVTNLHNPSGAALRQDDLAALAELTGRRGVWLIVDEVYRDLAEINRGESLPSAHVLGDHVVVTDSLTKVYGFSGLRAGWMIADPRFLDRARHVTDVLHVVDALPAARAAVAVIQNINSLRSRCRALYERTSPILEAWLARQVDLHAYPREGALFGWLRLGHGVDDVELYRLLDSAFDTSVVPGSFFGAPGHIRVGIAVDEATLAEGLDRVGQAIQRLAH